MNLKSVGKIKKTFRTWSWALVLCLWTFLGIANVFHHHHVELVKTDCATCQVSSQPFEEITLDRVATVFNGCEFILPFEPRSSSIVFRLPYSSRAPPSI